MAGPAAVVVAGAVTIWLAAAGADGLVIDNYYKRGLAINEEIGRERAAVERGISAEVTRTQDELSVRLTSSRQPPAVSRQAADVVPAEAGTQANRALDPRLRGDDVDAGRQPTAASRQRPAGDGQASVASRQLSDEYVPLRLEERSRSDSGGGGGAQSPAVGGQPPAGDIAGTEPEALYALLAHATRGGHDQRLRLARVAPGLYRAPLPELAPGRWRVVLEDPRGEWRIVKESL